ncbi:hypothetical protein MMPV_007912 [Pyropia vietnamensis]
MNLQLRGALDIFYTGDEVCLPGGPNFDRKFYLAWSTMLASIAGAAGVSLLYANVTAAIVDIAIVERWNRRAGISDKVFYLLGDTIIQEVVLMLDWMPAIVLTSKLCPTGVESTVYALLAGFQNFGASVASSLGVLALDIGGIKTPEDGPCDFRNLTLLIIVGHVVLPLLTIPLTFVLIPNAKMTDDLIGGLPMMAEAEGGSNRSDKDGGPNRNDSDGSSSNDDGEAKDGGGEATSVEVKEAGPAPSQEAPR